MRFRYHPSIFRVRTLIGEPESLFISRARERDRDIGRGKSAGCQRGWKGGAINATPKESKRSARREHAWAFHENAPVYYLPDLTRRDFSNEVQRELSE